VYSNKNNVLKIHKTKEEEKFMYYIFAFRSRSESMGFYQRLQATGLTAKLISTPRIISIGCGLSVKVATEFIDTANDALNACSVSTFLGLFYFNGKEIIRVREK